MKKSKPEDTTKAFERKIRQQAKEKYLLRLYVTGMTPRSTQAIRSIKGICEEHLNGQYDLEVIDLSISPVPGQGRTDHRHAHSDQKTPAALTANLNRRHGRYGPNRSGAGFKVQEMKGFRKF